MWSVCKITGLLFQTTSYMVSPSMKSSSGLMHFSILLLHASLHCWIDCYGMPHSSALRAGPIDDSLGLVKMKKKSQVNRGLIPLWGSFSRPRTAVCSRALWAGVLPCWSNHDLPCLKSMLKPPSVCLCAFFLMALVKARSTWSQLIRVGNSFRSTENLRMDTFSICLIWLINVHW